MATKIFFSFLSIVLILFFYFATICLAYEFSDENTIGLISHGQRDPNSLHRPFPSRRHYTPSRQPPSPLSLPTLSIFSFCSSCRHSQFHNCSRRQEFGMTFGTCQSTAKKCEKNRKI
ncbi:hypothetical protein RND81_07G152200 [Saponaria officinalis]|uniref:Transmembrane protein n=1 Tax=Saponaria officinalis TaxID=3572 RepID=A0AAW1JNN6_SAPOF